MSMATSAVRYKGGGPWRQPIWFVHGLPAQVGIAILMVAGASTQGAFGLDLTVVLRGLGLWAESRTLWGVL